MHYGIYPGAEVMEMGVHTELPLNSTVSYVRGLLSPFAQRSHQPRITLRRSLRRCPAARRPALSLRDV
jgi:hypothetical protein